jgi:hypothetical protein
MISRGSRRAGIIAAKSVRCSLFSTESSPAWGDSLLAKCDSNGGNWTQIDHPLSALKAVYGENSGDNHFIYSTLGDYLRWEVRIRRSHICAHASYILTYLSQVLVHDREGLELWCAVRATGPVVNAAGTLHGGASATLFDGAFGLLFSASKWRGFTASLNIDYRQVGYA